MKTWTRRVLSWCIFWQLFTSVTVQKHLMPVLLRGLDRADGSKSKLMLEISFCHYHFIVSSLLLLKVQLSLIFAIIDVTRKYEDRASIYAWQYLPLNGTPYLSRSGIKRSIASHNVWRLAYLAASLCEVHVHPTAIGFSSPSYVLNTTSDIPIKCR